MSLCHSCINEMELQQGKFSHYASCPSCEQPNNLYDIVQEPVVTKVHINELEVGDKINHFAGLQGRITRAKPGAKRLCIKDMSYMSIQDGQSLVAGYVSLSKAD